MGAVRGLERSLGSLVREDGVTHVAVAFDHVIESFRNDLFAGYKTAEGVPADLLAQFHPAEDAVRALGIVVWPMVEFEADDALATGAHRYAALPEVEQVVICSPDKDLAQCVRGTRVVTFDRMRRRLFDEDGVEGEVRRAPGLHSRLAGPRGRRRRRHPRRAALGGQVRGRRPARATAASKTFPTGSASGTSWCAAPPLSPRACAPIATRLASIALSPRLRTDVPLDEDLEALRYRGGRDALSSTESGKFLADADAVQQMCDRLA